MIWIFDIEIYINYFSVIFKNPKTKELKEFQIYTVRKPNKDSTEFNGIDDLYNFLNQEMWLIGYNSFNFDNQILNYIKKSHSKLTFMSPREITENIYNLANLIVKEDYREFKYNLPFKYLDLMKIGGFYKSLKLLGVSLK